MSYTKVLVVEDDIDLLNGLEEILKMEGYDVLKADNGFKGLETLRAHAAVPPDLIISDVRMPGMDGFELLREVRQEKQWINIPFIFLTARSDRLDIYEGKTLGADEYILKPYHAEDLLVTVRARLKRHRDLAAAQNDVIDSLKRKIITILNHEFRTPLSLVVAYADLLRDSDVSTMDETELLTFLHGVNSGAERLRRLVDNFILLVELETGEAAKNYSWRRQDIFNLPDLLQTAGNQATQVEGRQRDVILTLPDTCAVIEGDPQYLVNAMRELIDNAIKFSQDPVQVGLDCQSDYVEMWVMDTGRGIPDEEMKQIWNSFYQINREVLEDQGTGAGLAIVRGITRIHGGTVHAESTVGKGSRFTIRIPIKENQD